MSSVSAVEQWWQFCVSTTWQMAVVFGVVWCALRWLEPPVHWQRWVWRGAHLKVLLLALGVPSLSLSLPAGWLPWKEVAVIGHRDVAQPAPWERVVVGAQLSKSQVAQHPVASSGRHALSVAGVKKSLPWWKMLLFWLWCVGVLASLFWGVLAWRRSQQFRRDARQLLGEEYKELQEMLGELSERFGLSRVPAIGALPELPSPMVIGVWSPMVLLPESLLEEGGDDSSMRMLLAHELAHIRQCDVLWMLLPWCLRSMYFFHPMMWFASREWVVLQELEADSRALLQTSGAPATYGALLLRFAAPRAAKRAQVSLAFGGAHSTQTIQILKRRLIAMTKYRSLSTKKRVPMFISLGALCAVVLLPWQIQATPVKAAGAGDKKSVAARRVVPRSLPAKRAVAKAKKRKPITIMMFQDFQCSYCIKGQVELQKAARRFGKDVRVVLKHFPLSFHKRAYAAAVAIEAARKQGKVKAFSQRVLQFHQQLNQKTLHSHAVALGLDLKKFRAALKEQDTHARVKADIKLGRMLGIKGVPSLFVNGKLVTGMRPAAVIVAMIRREKEKLQRHKKGTRCPHCGPRAKGHQHQLLSLKMKLQFGVAKKFVEAQITVPFGKKAMFKHRAGQAQWTIALTPYRHPAAKGAKAVRVKFAITRVDGQRRDVTKPVIIVLSGQSGAVVQSSNQPKRRLRLWIEPTIQTLP